MSYIPTWYSFFACVPLASPTLPLHPVAFFCTMSAPAAQPVLPVDDSDDDMPSLSEELLSMISPEARAALEAHRAAQRQAAEKLAAEKADGSTEIGEDFGMSQFWSGEKQAKSSKCVRCFALE